MVSIIIIVDFVDHFGEEEFEQDVYPHIDEWSWCRCRQLTDIYSNHVSLCFNLSESDNNDRTYLKIFMDM